VPRETSNLSEVRFGDVAVLKQISVLHRKYSWKFSGYLFDLRFLVHMPQVISKLSLVLHFLIWATKNPRKNWPFSAVLFWQISATICVCLLIAFFFSSFNHKTSGEVAIVVYTLYVVVLSWNQNQKGLIHYYAYTNVVNRIVLSFVWSFQV
jgi:drug/metabolite transporter (DMT)-like permease